jgi:hypothetical protein
MRGMARNLSPELVSAIRARIQDPARRSAATANDTVEGTVTDLGQLAQIFEAHSPGSSVPFNAIATQLERWGQTMPAMYLTRHEGGGLGASSENPHGYPLAPPAAEAGFERLEAAIGRPLPDDLRQLYGIADGGFGPGLGYTTGFGPGLYSLERIGQALDELHRNGPGYQGEAWPPHLLPLTDDFGPVSYDLERGAIVAFDENYEDKGLTLEAAFADLHPSLEAWLADWLRR